MYSSNLLVLECLKGCAFVDFVISDEGVVTASVFILEERMAARLTDVVVLPTPSFPFAIASGTARKRNRENFYVESSFSL